MWPKIVPGRRRCYRFAGYRVQKFAIANLHGCRVANYRVVSNHWTGLWTGLLDWTDGLDCWTGLMDWITGLTIELNLFVSPDL